MAEAKGLTIDPEVQEILRKVAADPGSTLLRVQRPRSLRGFFDRGHGVSAVAAGLTSAERHLVRSYRGDVARVLREACRMKLIDGPGGMLHVSPFRSVHEEHVRWEPKELATHAATAYIECSANGDSDDVGQLLAQCVQFPVGAEPTVSQLAEASIRLEPTDEARSMAALGLIRGGAPSAGIRLLQYILDPPCSPLIEIGARNNLGMAYSLMGDMREALVCYTAACTSTQERLEPWMNRFVQAVQLGVHSDARIACSEIELLAVQAFPQVEWFASVKTTLRERGDWTPSGESSNCLHALGSLMGPAVRRIADAFSQ